MLLLAGKRQKKRRMLEYLSSMDESGDKNIIEFPFISFENIAIATDNFSDCNMIGKGGFWQSIQGTSKKVWDYLGNYIAVKIL